MSPIIQPDFSDVAELIPGAFNARVTKWEQKESQANPGNFYINWTCDVFGCEDEKLNGQKFWHMTMITGRGAGILKTFYKAVMHKELEKGESFDPEDFLGKEFRVVLVNDSYEGQDRIKVKSVGPLAD